MKLPVAPQGYFPTWPGAIRGTVNRPPAGNRRRGPVPDSYCPLKCLRRQFMWSSPAFFEQATYAL